MFNFRVSVTVGFMLGLMLGLVLVPSLTLIFSFFLDMTTEFPSLL